MKNQGKLDIDPKDLIMSIGHLTVYSKPSQLRPMGGSIFYYDKQFPVEMGPFNHASEAVSHWTAILSEKAKLEPSAEPEIDNVIHVDFVNKRRQPK